MKKLTLYFFVVLIGFAAFIYTQITVFVMPPLEPVSKGYVRVMWRDFRLGLIASPDSICMEKGYKEDKIAELNQICRGAVMLQHSELGPDADAIKKNVIFEFGYSQLLHGLSKIGKS